MLEFFLWSWILEDCSEFRKTKKKVVALCSRPPQNVKLGSFTSLSYSDGKEGYKTRVARAELLFCQSKPIAVLPFSLACSAGVFWAGQIVVNMALSRAKHSRARKKTSALRATLRATFSLMLPSSLLKLPYYNKLISTTFSKRSFQPRPQGFSLKKWVGPTHFFREKPRGRGCVHSNNLIKTWVLTGAKK